MKQYNLKVNYQKNPLGLGDIEPTFGWNIKTDQKNWLQSAYEIIVADNKKDIDHEIGNVWSSGKVNNKAMVGIKYKGKKLQSDTRYYWRVRIWDGDSQVSTFSEVAYFETGLLEESDWKGKWIGETEDHVNHIFRKTFSLKKKVKKAMIYVCGLGHYELYMNGSRMGDAVLEPGWTDYHKTCLYTSHDVTDQLKQGNNAMGAILGDGMYNVPKKAYVYYERTYGKMKLLVQLNITYEDGSQTCVVTDESWKMAKSPLTFSCIYGGEEYDKRLEQTGFSQASFQEKEDWEDVVVVDAPKGELIAQTTSPLKVMKTYEPVNIVETDPGIYLYDLGKNFSGWVKIQVRSNGKHTGETITMTPGEILTPEQKPDQRVTGEGYHWSITLNDDTEVVYEPRFTYYGFRYVEVKGAVPACLADENETRPVITSMEGQFIYPDMDVIGEFQCSNELFNQIHGIVNQAMLSNIKSVFTDCPHREKLGWLEETHLIGPAMMYNYDLYSLYEKIERDMKDSQHETGLVPDISPEYVTGFDKWHQGFVDSPEWGSACIINPWHLYKKYGDTKVFTKHYDVMKRYMNYLTSKTHHHMLHHGLGDWLDIGPNTPHSQNTPVPVIATAIYYYDLCIMSRVAKMLEREEDSKHYKELMVQVKKEYNLQFYDNQTYRYATGSQAAQAMSLVVGLVEEDQKEKVLGYLVTDIEKRNYATTAGDVGHPFVLAALTIYNRSDIINKMTNITDAPGYGYQVKNGATTLAEEWDGPEPGNPHGSQNHFMLGSIDEWFYAGLAGIGGLRYEVEFDEIIIKPHFAEEIDDVKAWHMHPYGKIKVRWQRKEEGMIHVSLELPPNTKTTFISEKDGSKTEFGSGSYEIII